MSPGSAGGAWLDVAVSAVVDGGCFWAHVGGDDALTRLAAVSGRLEALATVGRTLDTPPAVGDDVCGRLPPPDGRWQRGRVAAVDGERATVFAVDYGRCHAVPWRHLVDLKGTDVSNEPPLAKLCLLYGERPLSESSVL